MAKPWIGKDLTSKAQRAKILELNKWIELSTLKWATDFLNNDIERLNEINKITDEYVQCVVKKQTLLPRDIEMIDRLSNSIIKRMQVIDKIREDYVKKEADSIKEMLKETDEKLRMEIVEEFKKKQAEQELFIKKQRDDEIKEIKEIKEKEIIKEEEEVETKITFNI